MKRAHGCLEDSVLVKEEDTILKVTQELLCPITLTLPVCPVTAEDGYIYDRSAIQKWFSVSASSTNVRSPMTNLSMGTKITPSVQVGNIIEALIESNMVHEDYVDAYMKEKMANEWRDGVIAKAGTGDIESIGTVGKWYLFGEHGLLKNFRKAFYWLSMGAEKDDNVCKAVSGYLLCSGRGVKRNVSQGLLLLQESAMMKSEFACHTLGVAYIQGKYGLEAGSNKEVFKYFMRSKDCPIRDWCTSDMHREFVDNWLNTHNANMEP